MGFPGGLVVQNLPVNARDTGDMGFFPWVWKIPGVGHDYPLQVSLLENPMDRGGWQGAKRET